MSIKSKKIINFVEALLLILWPCTIIFCVIGAYGIADWLDIDLSSSVATILTFLAVAIPGCTCKVIVEEKIEYLCESFSYDKLSHDHCLVFQFCGILLLIPYALIICSRPDRILHLEILIIVVIYLVLSAGIIATARACKRRGIQA